MQGFWNLLGKSGQGPGKDFQYDIGEKISSSFDTKSVWNLYHGKKRTNGDLVSVFTCDAKESSPEELHLAKTACKRLKTLRHPNIIKFLDSFESESLVYVVTEPVIPLLNFLDEEDGRNASLITWGLHQVITGLSFLINNGNLQHENVNMFSIFVGLDGEWKLGGVEYVHTVDTDPVTRQPYLHCYDPPDSKGKRKEKWSSDAWGLGCLIWEIYNGALQNAADLKNIKKIPKPLVIHYCDLVSANPKSRTNPKVFLEKTTEAGQFLCNDFIKANIFLQEIQIQDINEQKKFFSSLDKSLDTFPKQFCVHKVLPQLLNAFEYGTAGSAVLSPLFKVGLLLDDAAYQSKIVPCIIKLFSSNDRATRIQLLQQMEKFVKHLQPGVVDTQIFPCVATGFGDTLPAMREQTVKAMLLLTPKLSEKTINNNLLRYFAKLQTDEQPGIRTNTTICIGRLATYFSHATRQKVLVPAFTRALRDPFPPARNAGVAAISACQEYFSIPEVAMKVLPALCTSAIDPEKSVRENVFQVINLFLKKLETYSNNPNSALNNKEVAEKEAQAQVGTWTGWAVTSLTSKFYQNQPRDQNESNTTNQPDTGAETNGKATSQESNLDSKNSLNNENQPPNKAKPPPNKGKELPNKDSDASDYDDAWEEEQWQDVKEEGNNTNFDASSSASIMNKLTSSHQTKAKPLGKPSGGGNDSDSDYGDEWSNDWDKKQVENKFEDWGQAKNDGWNEGVDDDKGGWGDMDDTWGLETSVDKQTKKKLANQKTSTEKSVADMLGMSSDASDFLSNEDGWNDDTSWDNGSANTQSTHKFASKPFASNSPSSPNAKTSLTENWGDNSEEGWNNDSAWNDGDLDNEKEKRKQELQKKREERKLQREQQNKEKRTVKTTGGALKLGAVKKK